MVKIYDKLAETVFMKDNILGNEYASLKKK